MQRRIQETRAYKLIAEFYGSDVAKRSRVPLINHIDQGLRIMQEIDASPFAMEAYCIHPLFQNDKELKEQGLSIAVWRQVDSVPLLLAMEYRNKANAWLSDKVRAIRHSDGHRFILQGEPDPGPLEEVKHMLIADKVQNYKDFITHHSKTHPLRHALDHYFKKWLEVLGVSEDQFQNLCHAAEGTK